MIRPIGHVRCRIDHPIFHLKSMAPGIVFIMAGKKIYSVVINHRVRIGRELRLDDWILRITGRPQVCYHSQYNAWDEQLYPDVSDLISHSFGSWRAEVKAEKADRHPPKRSQNWLVVWSPYETGGTTV
jgi:hypothetical protein